MLGDRALGKKEMSCTKAWESPTPSRASRGSAAGAAISKITGGFASFDYVGRKVNNKIRVKAFLPALLAS